jgi:hypothetical protein
VSDIKAKRAGVRSEAVPMMVEDESRDTKRISEEQNPGGLMAQGASFDHASSAFYLFRSPQCGASLHKKYKHARRKVSMLRQGAWFLKKESLYAS